MHSFVSTADYVRCWGDHGERDRAAATPPNSRSPLWRKPPPSPGSSDGLPPPKATETQQLGEPTSPRPGKAHRGNHAFRFMTHKGSTRTAVSQTAAEKPKMAQCRMKHKDPWSAWHFKLTAGGNMIYNSTVYVFMFIKRGVLDIT